MIVLFTVMLLVLLATGLPVGFALGTGGLVGMLLFMGGDGTLNQIPLLAYKSLDDFVLCAVPLYVLMSQILLEGKVGNDLFELGNKWLRHLPGGLGAATIVACGIFAAITGSSAACAVTIGAIAIPEMLKRNYERTVVLGAVAAGGTLGILIPPSIPMILYGAITGESIGQLFMSGVVPGFMLTIFFIGVVVYKSRNLPLEPKASWAERMDALKSSIWGLGHCRGRHLYRRVHADGSGGCGNGVFPFYYVLHLQDPEPEAFAEYPAGYGKDLFHDLLHHDRRHPVRFRTDDPAGAPGPDPDGYGNAVQRWVR